MTANQHSKSCCELQFVNNNQALATLPGGGVGQNLVSLAPCAVNQPHVHPRGTEISHVTKGTSATVLAIVLLCRYTPIYRRL